MEALTRKRRAKLLFLIFAGAISIVLLVYGGYEMVAFSDSQAFCGQLCHNVMYPEYTVYQVSPHSRVLCSDCHVGSGTDYLVRSKVTGIPLVFATLAGTYDKPIPAPVRNLRPARETCEQCHWPEKFSGDPIRVHTTFASDEQNSSNVDRRALRVGGGELETAQGIHWHIAAKVWYVPVDNARQEIVWVGVEEKDGTLTEYVDPKRTGEVSAQRIQRERRLMDCMDCHNRATHIFRSPKDLIDTAMAEGKIDPSLPFIKREGVKVLDPPNSTLTEAYEKAETIREFYRTNYPQVALEKAASIEKTITELKEVARLTTFPEMNVSWKTYVNNNGHMESPGCFRCHGKLVTFTLGKKDTIIKAECDTCHYTGPYSR
ncbi:MAG: NapC/NirT family cytochrome c [Chloroflexi bacterium]|nr:NapC/NirT family cytochrome c [Chloroflexota bacterium]